MNASIRIRLLGHRDLPFADSVRALAGWNQTLADWERFLASAPDGCFLAEWNGAPAGTATTVTYSRALAWIGMVLVHPDFRRRGIGRALLVRCIEHLRRRGVRCLKLDATPAGQPVYHSLGFKDEWPLSRWELAASAPRPKAPASEHVRDGCDPDAVETLDTQAFGVSRRRILGELIRQSRSARMLAAEPGRVAGYGMLREGAAAHYLGPVVADSTRAAAPLVDALLALTQERRVYWDVPDWNASAVALAVERGFTRQRTLTRMHLGANDTPGDPQRQFAIAGPELG